jgi:hypothetical protein
MARHNKIDTNRALQQPSLLFSRADDIKLRFVPEIGEQSIQISKKEHARIPRPPLFGLLFCYE